MTVTATPATIRVRPSAPSRAIGAGLTINYLPARFADATFDAGTVAFESREQMRQLRLDLAATHTVTKLGNQIVCVPYVDVAELFGEPVSFHTADDLDLSVRLLRAAIIRLLTQPPWGYLLRSFAPPEFVSRRPGRDLMIPALAGIRGCEEMHVFPKFTLDTRRTGPCGLPGVLLGLKTHHEIDTPISDLIQRGVSVTGRAVLAIPDGATAAPGQDPTVLRRLRGIITAADQKQLRVDTGTEIITLPATQAWLEARRDVFHDVLAALSGASAQQVIQRLNREVVGIVGAEGRLARTGEIGDRLVKAGPFTIANGVQAQLAPPVGSSERAHQVTSRTVAEPMFVFDMAGGKQRRYADPGLSECGPFDADGFRRKSPRIAVIVPIRYTQQANRFMSAFRDGVPDSDAFSQGFVRKFRLKDCTFQVTAFDGGPRDADAYRQACLDAVSTEPAPDLAVVITSQQQEQLTGDESPYLVAKATLMSHAVPVQEIQVETIDRRDLAQPLNTLALACYAKLGGTPYVISVPEPNVEHELVIGIGSAHIQQHRMSTRQRYVGITSVSAATATTTCPRSPRTPPTSSTPPN